MFPTAQDAAVVPRVAIGFDDSKKAIYRDGSIREEALPTFGDCLQAGFRPCDMVVGADGRPVMPGQAEMHGHTAGAVTDVHLGI